MPDSKNTPLQNVAFQPMPTVSAREAGPRRSFEGSLIALEVLHSQCAAVLKGH